MDYCLPADIDIPLAELAQLCDDNVPLLVTAEIMGVALEGGSLAAYSPSVQAAATVAAGRVAKAIADAGELIDGYVSGRYQVPLTVVPSLVKAIAVDIALYKIYMRRKKRAVPEMVQKAYDNATKLLGDIQAGKVTIGATPSGQQVPVTVGGVGSFVSGARICSRDTMKDY